MQTKLKAVLGVIGADCHAVGNKIIMSVLEPLGIEIVNLGVMVSQDEFIDAALRSGAQAILVSSIYGHGEIDCAGFRDRCDERGLPNILLYVGGNLVIGKREFTVVESLYKSMGFDRVFAPSVDLEDVADLLKNDIDLKYRWHNNPPERLKPVALQPVALQQGSLQQKPWQMNVGA